MLSWCCFDFPGPNVLCGTPLRSMVAWAFCPTPPAVSSTSLDTFSTRDIHATVVQVLRQQETWQSTDKPQTRISKHLCGVNAKLGVFHAAQGLTAAHLSLEPAVPIPPDEELDQGRSEPVRFHFFLSSDFNSWTVSTPSNAIFIYKNINKIRGLNF